MRETGTEGRRERETVAEAVRQKEKPNVKERENKRQRERGRSYNNSVFNDLQDPEETY